MPKSDGLGGNAMPDSAYNSYTGAQKIADLTQAALANAVVHLFQDNGFTPTPTTVLADFNTNEADFDGYAAETVVAWPAETVVGTSWALIDNIRFDFDSGVPNAGGNQIAGWYLVSAAGVLLSYGLLDPSVPMMADGQACFVTPVVLIPFGQTL